MSQLGLGVESMDGVGVGDGDSWGDPVPIGETDHTDPDFGLWEFHASSRFAHAYHSYGAGAFAGEGMLDDY